MNETEAENKNYMENAREKILSNVDIVNVISEYVALKPAGANYSARCPFHNEKTPSFMVSPIKQIFHCFGCGVGGTAIEFIERINGLNYFEALKFLADKYGIELPKYSQREQKTDSNLIDINTAALRFFKNNLKSNKFAEDYIRKRGLTDDTVVLFGVGYALDKWDALKIHLNQLGFKDEKIMEAGLIIKREDGGYYDRFRNRIIFPIFDISSKPVAFGGRVLEDNADYKYINSPETQIYHKGAMLYGLHLSKKYIMQENRVLILEGYIDLITCFQFGIKNVVATLGTALTATQIKLLSRFTKNMVMIYDGDAAGISAMARSIEKMLELDVYPDVYVIEDDMDPAELLLLKGSDYFLNKLRRPQSFFDFYIDKLIKDTDISTIKGKRFVVQEMVNILKHIRDNLVLSEYIKKMSEILIIDYKVLYSEMKKLIKSANLKNRAVENIGNIENEPKESDLKILTKTSNLELKMLALLIDTNDKNLIDKYRQLIVLEELPEPLNLIFKFIFDNDNADLQELLDYFREAAAVRRILTSISLIEKEREAVDTETLANNYMTVYVKRRLDRETKQFAGILRQNKDLVSSRIDDAANLLKKHIEEKLERLKFINQKN